MPFLTIYVLSILNLSFSNIFRQSRARFISYGGVRGGGACDTLNAHSNEAHHELSCSRKPAKGQFLHQEGHWPPKIVEADPGGLEACPQKRNPRR
jgi:hypothetical protein